MAVIEMNTTVLFGLCQFGIGLTVLVYVLLARPYMARENLRLTAQLMEDELMFHHTPGQALPSGTANVLVHLERLSHDPRTAAAVLRDIDELIAGNRDDVMSGELMKLRDGCSQYLHQAWPVAGRGRPVALTDLQDKVVPPDSVLAWASQPNHRNTPATGQIRNLPRQNSPTSARADLRQPVDDTAATIDNLVNLRAEDAAARKRRGAPRT